MIETSSWFWEKETWEEKIKRWERERETKREEYISQLQKQGETHLIVSTLITKNKKNKKELMFCNDPHPIM